MGWRKISRDLTEEYKMVKGVEETAHALPGVNHCPQPKGCQAPSAHVGKEKKSSTIEGEVSSRSSNFCRQKLWEQQRREGVSQPPYAHSLQTLLMLAGCFLQLQL